ncbi:MAG: Divalent cation transporter [Candidatus Methanofastidiosum methylothiophilum]|uniref:Divalent cation transporter n=1 Tax=Candidatus Methanofastidiosum methylothiophilum TaxID=1705564 RepID=A0A150J2R9_9EURY|nr:MAG: Divalent cation transporter [Candidatus Methanofastidiosum methylthiophilus]KYC48566.1 MAG: Divalent cation transporter [Candidatus Methanofastidiosum methylthiophilus]KYC51264.1 MAG: Divalent cation transporter [Candidatus Methanofastidiosum methylthiophilus]
MKKKKTFPIKVSSNRFVAWPPKIDFSDFSTIIKQSMFALIICAFADIFAGIYLTKMIDILILLPGILTMLPAAIDMRGNIYASMGSRLSTGLHTGEITPSLRGSKLIKENVYSSLVQTVIMASVIAFFAMIGGFIFGNQTIGFIHLFFISLFASLIAAIGLILTTIFVAIISFKKGLDPDNVSSPLIASIGDILNVGSLFAIGILSFSISKIFMLFSSIGISALIVFLALFSIRKSYYARRILKESMGFLAICALLSTLAGSLLDKNLEFIEIFPLLLVLSPLFNAENGNIGSILSARISTSFHLGQSEITFIPKLRMIKEFSYTFIITIILFPLLAILAFIMSGILKIPQMGLFTLFEIAILVAIISSIAGMLTSYYLTYFSIRTNIDPDNVVIPLLTSVMDIASVTILIFIASIVLF